MRRIITAVFFLLAGTQAFAQNLDGTWRGPIRTDDEKDGINLTVGGHAKFTFSGERCALEMDLDIDLVKIEGNGKDPDFQVVASNSGTWKRDGKYLDFTPIHGVKPVVTVKSNGVPVVIAKIIEKPIRKEVSKILKTPGRFEIIQVTDKEIILREVKSGWDKKGKKTKPVRYIRQ